LQYALGDFAVRQAAIALNKSAADIDKYANRSMNFINHWNANLTFDGFSGFMQRRYPVSSFFLGLSYIESINNHDRTERLRTALLMPVHLLTLAAIRVHEGQIMTSGFTNASHPPSVTR
jgi:hypothetical protein